MDSIYLFTWSNVWGESSAFVSGDKNDDSYDIGDMAFPVELCAIITF
jgi:hypothetical protein